MEAGDFTGWSLCRFLILSVLSFRVANARNGYGRGWQPATATWYGSASGDGSDGGACGFGKLEGTPYGLDVGAASPVLYKNGRGCGTCFKIKCMDPQICSPRPVKVVLTDECPGGYCAFGRTHFDLSGTAFGKMAVPGKVPKLLNAGVLQVYYRRVDCSYKEPEIEFEVNAGATAFWFSVLIRYEAGAGDLASVHLLQSGSTKWQPMQQIWGANWVLNCGPLQAPFSIRLTSLSTSKTITAYNVIPRNWSPGRTYESHVNFMSHNSLRI